MTATALQPLPAYDWANEPSDENRRPYLAQVETSTVCNATCTMCPRDKATRSTHADFMETDTFKSVIKQLREDIGIKLYLPFIDAEPLADKRLIDLLEWSAREYPDLEIVLYTNASLLTEDKARRLLNLGVMKHFNVSMQGGDKETYEKTMGLPYERTVKNVERLLEMNKALGQPCVIRANMCVFSPTSASAIAFREKWEPLGAMICLGAYSNFGGLGSDEEGEAPWRGVKRQVCDRGTKHIYIYANGDVGMCCFDLIGSAIFGNVKSQRIYDIWDSEKARKVRKAHWEIDVKNMAPICWKCNASKFHG